MLQKLAELTVSPVMRSQALDVFTYFARSSSELFGARTTKIEWSPDDGWLPINPSICLEERRLSVVRTVNYFMSKWKPLTLDGFRNLRTRSYVVELDANWSVKSATEIRDATGILACDDGFRAHGFEDLRLVRNADGSYWASGSLRNLLPGTDHGDPYGSSEMGCLYFDEAWNVVDVKVIRDYEAHLLQKNWMPVSGSSGLFLYTCDPTIAVSVNGVRTVEVARHETPVCLTDIRGGSQLVKFGAGYLCLAHEVAYRENERFYLHRFIRFDSDFRITSVSEPFYFARLDGIEFCAGLGWDGDQLVASFGMNEGGSAHLTFFEPNRVEIAMEPLGEKRKHA